MGLEAYLFAFFLFGLLCMLVLLYRRLGQPSKAQTEASEAARQKEERLFRLYQNIEETMDNFEGYLEQSRTQMEQEKALMVQQMEEVRELCRRAEAVREQAEQEAAQVTEAVHEKAAPQAPRSSRHEAVRSMLEQGKTIEEIAQAMDASINEIKLVAYGLGVKKGS